MVFLCLLGQYLATQSGCGILNLGRSPYEDFGFPKGWKVRIEFVSLHRQSIIQIQMQFLQISLTCLHTCMHWTYSSIQKERNNTLNLNVRCFKMGPYMSLFLPPKSVPVYFWWLWKFMQERWILLPHNQVLWNSRSNKHLYKNDENLYTRASCLHRAFN